MTGYWDDEPPDHPGRDWAVTAAVDLALLVAIVVFLAWVFL